MNFNNNNNQNLDGAGLNQGYGKGEEYGFSGTTNFAGNPRNGGNLHGGNQPYTTGSPGYAMGNPFYPPGGLEYHVGGNNTSRQVFTMGGIGQTGGEQGYNIGGQANMGGTNYHGDGQPLMENMRYHEGFPLNLGQK
jgi:hypothetical protein